MPWTEGQRETYLACIKFQLGDLCEALGRIPVKEIWHPWSDIYNFIHYEKEPKQAKTVKEMGSIEC